MKTRLSILILILCFGYITKAQNLVPNGYFEVYDTCPGGISSYPNPMQINHAIPWQASTLTPDYYDTCSNTAPQTFVGYQKDCCNGGGFLGIYALDKNSTNNNDREYISTKLTDTLKIGHTYLSSMYINKSDGFDYAISSFGMLFTDTSTTLPWPQSYIPANPQVKNNMLIYDTLNWILVQDTFMLTTNKTYLTIGNFSLSSLSDSLKVGGNGEFFGQAYYFIDGVSVYDITNGTCNAYWDAGYDKYIKEGDSIRLGAINTDNSTYVWQNSMGGTTYLSSNTDARPWSKPSQTTTYYVTKTCPNNNVFKDTVTVYVQQITGIKQILDNSRINLYPNPSNGTMFIDYNFQENAQLEITDITGHLAGTYNMPLVKTQLQIKNSELPGGIYFYRVMCKDTVVKLGKIVIIK